MTKRLLTLATMAATILAGAAAVAGTPWWIPAIAIVVGAMAFWLGAGLRDDRRTRTRPLGMQYQYRAIWLLAAGFVAAPAEPVPSVVIVTAGLALILSEPLLVRAWGQLQPMAANLPGVHARPWVRLSISAFVLLPAITTVALVLAPVAGTAALWAAAAAIATAASLGAALTVAALRSRSADRGRVAAAIEAYRPEFALYFSAPPASEYQVKMWLPYLEQVGAPWMIVLREERYLHTIAGLTDRPVIVAPSLHALDEAMVPSLQAVFYVNNGFKNSHCVRYGNLTHVQLLHGDSDKASSFNPVTAMFDKIFVAGQAGVDRYAAHGVHIPADRFEIVGRPQIEGITVQAEPAPITTVLYAPTWQGFQEGANFSSLPHAQEIINGLLDAGMRVIFRAHPFSADHAESARVIDWVHERLRASTSPERPHLFGEDAMAELSLVDCFNASDALVSDISSVPGDYLFSGKPLITVKTVPGLTATEFAEEFPLTRASYVWSPELGGIAPIIEEMTGADPLRAQRMSMRVYYLGDFAADGYAQHFVDAARAVLTMASAEVLAA